ncbi:unnamed protein product [Hermetia illucens]|uniref:Uncharacterized protein n=1 Tax=Hermetia illucens TaxID=343691 RepID=A0A7R8UPF3_HERIL|nr:uncharacterized protein LOC119652811 [Hermetia illucens]CAD7084597.1 unnamed protein product [Hermetia illucens]
MVVSSSLVALLISVVTISFPAVVAADSSEEVTYPICAVKCAVTGSPVCGERDGDYKLFINGCAKMSHYCNTGETWEETDITKCVAAGCPISCSKYDDDICATNGSVYKHFSNQCDYLRFVCKKPKEAWTRVTECHP